MLSKQPQAIPKAAGAKTEILDITQPQESGVFCVFLIMLYQSTIVKRISYKLVTLLSLLFRAELSVG